MKEEHQSFHGTVTIPWRVLLHSKGMALRFGATGAVRFVAQIVYVGIAI